MPGQRPTCWKTAGHGQRFRQAPDQGRRPVPWPRRVHLAKMRVRGDGPPYSKAGSRVVVYDLRDLNDGLRGNSPDVEPHGSKQAIAPGVTTGGERTGTMCSDQPWVLKIQEALAAGQAGDGIASDDPYIRMLLAARRRSRRRTSSRSRIWRPSWGCPSAPCAGGTTTPRRPNGYSPTMSSSFATKSGSRPMLHVRSPVHVTSSAVSTAISTSSASNSGKFGGGAREQLDPRPPPPASASVGHPRAAPPAARRRVGGTRAWQDRCQEYTQLDDEHVSREEITR